MSPLLTSVPGYFRIPDENECLSPPDWLYAAEGNAGGSTGKSQPGREANGGSITDPDTPLTGDTGNMEIGQTDLGAGPVGAGGELATDDAPSAEPTSEAPDDQPNATQSDGPTGEIADPEAGVGHS